MKIEIKVQTQFPVIMQSCITGCNDLRVLFTAPKCGMVIKPAASYKLGDVRSDWSIGTFEPIDPDLAEAFSKIIDQDHPMDYPTIMRVSLNGLIVLFAQPSTGTVLQQGESAWPIGHCSDMWDMEQFERFDGEVILSN